MSVKCVFMDNEIYGADDVNQIFSRLTTQGVSLFKYSDGDNPLIDLNTAVSNFVTPGVDCYNNDSCKVYHDIDNDRFCIHTGLAFMYDGSVIEINDEDYEITDRINEIWFQNPESSIYVYFKRVTEENTIKICVEAHSETPVGENVLVLARINADTTIDQMRTFAKTKVSPCAGNNVIVDSVALKSFKYDTVNQSGYLVGEIDGVFSGAKYFYLVNDDMKLSGDCVLEIQEVENANGLNLVFSNINESNKKEFVAINRRGTVIEIWRKTLLIDQKESTWNYMIF